MFPLSRFEGINTPFYYYDLGLLRETLSHLKNAVAKYDNFSVHYAMKANTNPKVLEVIAQEGLGADCVSGGEIKVAIEAGFKKDSIVYAGVGKSDNEINLGLDNNIFCFNVESVEELEVIDELASKKDKIAPVCLRINPNVDAHTHANITTGLSENKFGIPMEQIEAALNHCLSLSHVKFIGLHFHIGSQILDMNVFRKLSIKINELQARLHDKGIVVKHINVGGGLGINYDDPQNGLIPDFESYFKTYADSLKLYEGQTVHFELGRAIVAQCGSLISRILYIKKGLNKKFMILDASMTELIRPALYDAKHKIENISNKGHYESSEDRYDVVGPVCESSDVFGVNMVLPQSMRGDFIAIRSAGAYGEVMASQYNCRPLPKNVYSEID